jgi:arginase family enzyme
MPSQTEPCNHFSPSPVSYDIDAVDPLHAPATGTTVRGGLTFREAHYVCEAVSESGMLASCDMVEVREPSARTLQPP